MNKLLYILLILVISCKSTSTTTTKTHSINDTIIYREVKNVQLPIKNVTIIESPCKNDSLKSINQTIKSGKSTTTIKNENGNLVVETNIDSIVNSRLSEILKHTEKQVEHTESIITKYRTPKFWWWFLGVVLVYVAYRIARIYLPFIRFLPY